MTILVAPDKFKGTLTAAEAAEAIADGLAGLGLPVVRMPVADGGDGTVDAVAAAGFARRTATVTGPAGGPVAASYAVRGTTAVIELAEASGLRRLPGGRPCPLTATTRGTGELVDAALRGGATRIVLGLGGSATTDGGAGLAAALGARFRDAAGNPLPPGGAALRDLADLDLGAVRARLRGAEIVVATDVDNPLLGPDGAAAVFGPQKGATPGDVAVLEAGLARLAALAPDPAAARRPGAGAAGGAGFAALAFLGATVRPGIDYLLDLIGFAEKLADATVVITGEGSLDHQSLRGKAPYGVARAAARAGVPVVALAGRSELGAAEARQAGFAAVRTLTSLVPPGAGDPLAWIVANGPAQMLRALAASIARDLPGGPW
ncbi:Glycerate 2-kinase [Actinomadura rubteroloni]|uniref:Glycerate 2-kinase n=1 Tax=Actinomadura rubteroloni TaxID=1926885 RepID=A0A2P4UI02_9ACTN|nr:Glycerate 2-kinase [Actinomadura rubteroloni]